MASHDITAARPQPSAALTSSIPTCIARLPLSGESERRASAKHASMQALAREEGVRAWVSDDAPCLQ